MHSGRACCTRPGAASIVRPQLHRATPRPHTPTVSHAEPQRNMDNSHTRWAVAAEPRDLGLVALGGAASDKMFVEEATRTETIANCR